MVLHERLNREAQQGMITAPFHPPAPIPHGVADYFWAEARQRRQMEQEFLSLFRSWGYGDVMPPSLEYGETLDKRANRGLQGEIMRFLDRDGSTLALRPDMTIAVARLVGTRLHDWPMPQRFCYAGSVFRYTEPQAGRQREFWQAGVELMGAANPEADAEVLALTLTALRNAGLPDVRLVLGQMAYFNGLLQELHLSAEQSDALHQAIDRNSEAALGEFLLGAELDQEQRTTVEQLPALSGPDCRAVIARAERLCLNSAMQAAIDNLRAILAVLNAYDLDDAIYLDLTEINNLGYYTGITFEALTPQLGVPMASGGRYDHLVGTFGHEISAVGVALDIDRILLAMRLDTGKISAPRPVAVDMLVNAGNNAEALTCVQTWRSAGLAVAVEITGRSGLALAKAAHEAGAAVALTWTEAGFERYSELDRVNAEDAPHATMAPGEAMAWADRLLANKGVRPS